MSAFSAFAGPLPKGAAMHPFLGPSPHAPPSRPGPGQLGGIIASSLTSTDSSRVPAPPVRVYHAETHYPPVRVSAASGASSSHNTSEVSVRPLFSSLLCSMAWNAGTRIHGPLPPSLLRQDPLLSSLLAEEQGREVKTGPPVTDNASRSPLEEGARLEPKSHSIGEQDRETGPSSVSRNSRDAPALPAETPVRGSPQPQAPCAQPQARQSRRGSFSDAVRAAFQRAARGAAAEDQAAEEGSEMATAKEAVATRGSAACEGSRVSSDLSAHGGQCGQRTYATPRVYTRSSIPSSQPSTRVPLRDPSLPRVHPRPVTPAPSARTPAPTAAGTRAALAPSPAVVAARSELAAAQASLARARAEVAALTPGHARAQARAQAGAEAGARAGARVAAEGSRTSSTPAPARAQPVPTPAAVTIASTPGPAPSSVAVDQWVAFPAARQHPTLPLHPTEPPHSYESLRSYGPPGPPLVHRPLATHEPSGAHWSAHTAGAGSPVESAGLSEGIEVPPGAPPLYLSLRARVRRVDPLPPAHVTTSASTAPTPAQGGALSERDGDGERDVTVVIPRSRSLAHGRAGADGFDNQGQTQGGYVVHATLLTPPRSLHPSASSLIGPAAGGLGALGPIFSLSPPHLPPPRLSTPQPSPYVAQQGQQVQGQSRGAVKALPPPGQPWPARPQSLSSQSSASPQSLPVRRTLPHLHPQTEAGEYPTQQEQGGMGVASAPLPALQVHPPRDNSHPVARTSAHRQDRDHANLSAYQTQQHEHGQKEASGLKRELPPLPKPQQHQLVEHQQKRELWQQEQARLEQQLQALESFLYDPSPTPLRPSHPVATHSHPAAHSHAGKHAGIPLSPYRPIASPYAAGYASPFVRKAATPEWAPVFTPNPKPPVPATPAKDAGITAVDAAAVAELATTSVSLTDAITRARAAVSSSRAASASATADAAVANAVAAAKVAVEAASPVRQRAQGHAPSLAAASLSPVRGLSSPLMPSQARPPVSPLVRSAPAGGAAAAAGDGLDDAASTSAFSQTIATSVPAPAPAPAPARTPYRPHDHGHWPASPGGGLSLSFHPLSPPERPSQRQVAANGAATSRVHHELGDRDDGEESWARYASPSAAFTSVFAPIPMHTEESDVSAIGSAQHASSVAGDVSVSNADKSGAGLERSLELAIANISLAEAMESVRGALGPVV